MKNPISCAALRALPLMLLLLLLSVPVIVASQTLPQKPSETYLYDEDWVLTTDNKKARYYRHIFRVPGQEKFLVKDFFKSGKLESECWAIDMDHRAAGKLVYDGVCKSYFEDGKLYFTREYVKGIRDGYSKDYFDGNYIEGYFKDGLEQGPFNFLDEDGNFLFRTFFSGGVADPFVLMCFKDGRCVNRYSEEFSDLEEARENGWILDSVTGQVDDGKGASIALTERGDTFQKMKAGLMQTDLFSVEAEFVISDGVQNGAGIVFGGASDRNFNYFRITSDGRYSIGERVNGLDKAIVENRPSSAIKRGAQPNYLEVRSVDTGFDFYINEELVYEHVGELRWHGEFGGFVAGTGSGQVSLNQFVVAFPTERPDDFKISPPAWWNTTGSGFVFSTDGHIVTNHHVIEGASRVEVSVKVGDEWKEVPAEIVAFDATNDLALLKVDPIAISHLKSIPYRMTTDLVDIGTKTFTLGFPEPDILGDEMKFSEGSLSSRSGLMGNVSQYQVSIPVHPGNSGGPLFDGDGNLIGVINARARGFQNVGYGIKARYLADMLKSMDNAPRIPSSSGLEGVSQTERIKALSRLVVFIKVKS